VAARRRRDRRRLDARAALQHIEHGHRDGDRRPGRSARQRRAVRRRPRRRPARQAVRCRPGTRLRLLDREPGNRGRAHEGGGLPQLAPSRGARARWRRRGPASAVRRRPARSR
jgi:hypothetical protein